MDVRAQMLVFPGFWPPWPKFWAGISARMTPGRLSQKLPLWAELSFLIEILSESSFFGGGVVPALRICCFKSVSLTSYTNASTDGDWIQLAGVWCTCGWGTQIFPICTNEPLGASVMGKQVATTNRGNLNDRSYMAAERTAKDRATKRALIILQGCVNHEVHIVNWDTGILEAESAYFTVCSSRFSPSL